MFPVTHSISLYTWTMNFQKLHPFLTKISRAYLQPVRNLTFSVKNNFITIYQNKESRTLSFQWLRDNSRSTDSYNSRLLTKIVLPHHFDPDIKPSKIETRGETLCFDWSDGDRAKYPASWLFENSYPGPEKSSYRLLWDKDILTQDGIPAVNFSECMEDDKVLESANKKLLKYGFMVVDGVFDPRCEPTMHGVENTKRY